MIQSGSSFMKTSNSFNPSSFSRDHQSKLRYSFPLNDLKRFLYPDHLQNPLSTGRLYVFAYCGPFDENGKLRCGYKGIRTMQEYELEEMCQQYEREDLIHIYLHKPCDFGSLLMAEQNGIIYQADGHLKCAKGKAYLPNITPSEVDSVFAFLSRNELGELSFHEVQDEILRYRKERIQTYKLVYPQLHNSIGSSSSNHTETTVTRKYKSKIGPTVSETVAPCFMFQHMKGLRNSDIIDKVRNKLYVYF
jgi:hypothetical protein